MRIVLVVTYLSILLFGLVAGMMAIPGMNAKTVDYDSIDNELNGIITKTSIDKLNFSNGTNYHQVLNNYSPQFFKKKTFSEILIYKKPHVKPVWFKKLASVKKSIISSAISRNIWQSYLHNKLIKDEESGRSFVIKVLKKNNESIAVLAVLKFIKKSFLGKLEGKFEEVKRIINRSWKWLLSVLVLFFIFSVFSSFFISFFGVIRPIREFSGLLDFWDNPQFRYKKIKGMMRYSLLHVVELLERSKIVKQQPELNLVDKVLPEKNGFDFNDFNAGAYSEKLNNDKKIYYDIFHIDKNRYGIFASEISKSEREHELAMLECYMLARAYCKSFTNPAMIINEINKTFYNDKASNSINIFIGLLNTQQNQLVFSNGGEITLRKYDYEKEKVEDLILDNSPIGIFEPDKYKGTLKFGRLAVNEKEIIGIFAGCENNIFGLAKEIDDIMFKKKSLGEKVIAFRSLCQKKLKADRSMAGLFLEV